MKKKNENRKRFQEAYWNLLKNQGGFNGTVHAAQYFEFRNDDLAIIRFDIYKENGYIKKYGGDTMVSVIAKDKTQYDAYLEKIKKTFKAKDIVVKPTKRQIIISKTTHVYFMPGEQIFNVIDWQVETANKIK